MDVVCSCIGSISIPDNFRRVPAFITARLQSLGAIEFRVGVVKRIPLADITAGNWEHVGIGIGDGQVVIETPVLPNPTNGRASHFNVQGREVVRKDLPKEGRSINLGERPIWGDWSKGTFDLTVVRPCYQRETIPAPRVTLESRMLDTEETGLGMAVIYISAGRTHRSTDADLDTSLLHDLNLLQENVHSVDLVPGNSSDDALLGRLYVNWEILPPGERDATLASILSRYRPQNDEERQIIQERYQSLAQLEPDQWIVGLHSFAGYFGIIKNGRVAFENVRYGNAIYSMGMDWEELSQHSRTDLLNNYADRIERIVHIPGWQNRLTQVMTND